MGNMLRTNEGKQKMSFVDRLLANVSLTSGMRERGYSEQSCKMYDKNFCVFESDLFDSISTEISFNGWEHDEFRCGISLSSIAVQKYFDSFCLKFDEESQTGGESKVVLVVDLHWLRCNSLRTVERSEDKYQVSTTYGIRDFFFDLDTYGKVFSTIYSNPIDLAHLLVDLNGYPKFVEIAGAPRSVDPYIYASLLFYSCGKIEEATNALDKGLKVYSNVVVPWQAFRLERYIVRREKILAKISAKPPT